MAYGLLFDYLTGQCIEAYKYFGAHFETREVKEIINIPLKKDPSRTKKSSRKKLIEGVVFRLYAPAASDVSVIGDWNNWDPTVHKILTFKRMSSVKKNMKLNLLNFISKIDIINKII